MDLIMYPAMGDDVLAKMRTAVQGTTFQGDMGNSAFARAVGGTKVHLVNYKLPDFQYYQPVSVLFSAIDTQQEDRIEQIRFAKDVLAALQGIGEPHGDPHPDSITVKITRWSP